VEGQRFAIPSQKTDLVLRKNAFARRCISRRVRERYVFAMRRSLVLGIGIVLAACSDQREPELAQSAGAPSQQGGRSASGASGQSGSAAGASGQVQAPRAGEGNAGAAASGAGAGAAGLAAAGTGTTAGESAPMPDATVTDPDTLPLVPDPSWHCNLPDGIPVPESGELVFEAELRTGAILDLGPTQYGARRVIPIDGGTLSGPRIEGEFQDLGLEWELTTAEGNVELEARNAIRTSSGALVYMRTCGAARGGSVRIVPDFEASSSGANAWLNQGTYVGTRELGAGTMTLRVFQVAMSSPTPSEATLGPTDQPWNCSGPSGGVGSESVLQAAVNIGGSLAVGASKYGSRNIIPITGGTFTGAEVQGDVIAGGADFQLSPSGGGGLQIEARYTLRSDDGQLISVRNCGGGGGTALVFETRQDGPYAWMNAEGFTGTIGLRLGGVLISVFK
jgi:hypothetical protein